jgi:prepilin-type N-terminal cleavage/methylation domain-containing protein
MRRSNKGFTLIELMIVVVIIGVLAALAVPRYMRAATKSKQSEAREILKQIYTMERAYFIENETYVLNGVTASAANPLAYLTLAIEIMPSARYTYTITMPDANHFSCIATANLDDDAIVDTWTIDQTGILVNNINDSVL